MFSFLSGSNVYTLSVIFNFNKFTEE